MDQFIRSQLLSAVHNGDSEKLIATYEKIKLEGRKGATQSLSPDLFVVLAETAIKINLIKHHELIKESLAFYTKLKPKENQFLARCYLCYAHLFKPLSTRDTDKLEKCSSYILKAIDFGKKNPRYHFLVVNSSILFWKLARPFLVVQSIHCVVNTLGSIVKALNKIDDGDKKWLLNISLSYIESLYRDGQQIKAEKETKIAIKLAKSKCSEILPDVISTLSTYGLVSSSEMEKLPLNLILTYEINTLKSKLQRNSYDDMSLVSKILSDIIGKIIKGKSESDLDPDIANELLLEILIICLQYRMPDLAEKCLSLMQKPFTDVNFEFRIKFAEADLIVKKLAADELSYKKSVLKIRMKAINIGQEALSLSIHQCDQETIQSGCVTLWNLCLPLLQHNLRQMITSPLHLIASSLEDLQSMLVLVRCQVHIELAKCYQDQEKLIDALDSFNKALNLDPDGQYKETILYHIKCINLKTNLYKKPETVEEKAGFLLEQAKTAKTTSSKNALQPLLLKIGEYLAPNTFNWGIKELRENSQNCKSFIVLRDKIIKYKEAKTKGKAEMDRLSQANTHERFILWADVAKLARKEEVWDVALTASRFALWFEEQYSYQPSEEDDTESIRKSNNSRASSIKSDKQANKQLKPKGLTNFSKSNTILVAELNFIYAESLIYFLMQERLVLGQSPKLPGQIVQTEEELLAHMDYEHWKSYCDWILQIQEECVSHFLKGGRQGIALKEWWLVNNSCVYIWNYLKQTIDNNNHKNVIDWLSKAYELLISSKGNADFVLVCQFVEALCQGYLSKHNIDKLVSQNSSSRKGSPSKMGGKKSATPQPTKGKGGKDKGKDAGPALEADIVDDLTKAILIAETVYGHVIGNESVGLEKRKALLCLWVRCKQILSQSLKTLLPDEENTDSFSVACKSIVAVEMNHLNTNNFYVFPNTPSMQETIKMVDTSDWSDKVIELEIWTKLATLSLKLSNKELVDMCCSKITKLQDHDDLKKSSCKVTANKLLCYHNLILGKSELMFSNKTVIADRLYALSLFADAARSAEIANDYSLAMEVVQHFWNAILPHLTKKHERGQLKNNLLKILKVIANLAPDKNLKLLEPSFEQKNQIDLRAHLYGTLFIIYLDEKDWSSGLEQAEKAALGMPRPTHPLILKYRAMFKVNLGISPNGDMAKLERIESEAIVSEMWHRVAMTSSNKEEQLYALQQSIMLLQDRELRTKKIECVLRLAEWLFVNQYPINDVLDQLDWALDIAVGLKADNAGTILMPIEDQIELSKSKSGFTRSIRTRQTASTVQASLSDDKIDIISKPKPLLSYVEEVMEKLEEVEDLQRGELIARILVVRSKMLCYSGGDVKQSMIVAFNMYKHILEMCLTNFDQGSPLEEKPSTSHGKGAKGGAKADKPGNAKKTSNSNIQIGMPTNLPDWSIFRIPDNMYDVLKDNLESNVVNKVTFPQPELSLYYMGELCRHLEFFGLIDHLLPIYCLQEVLASAILNNKPLVSLIHYKAARNCQQLQLQQGFVHHLELASNSVDDEYVSNIINLELLKSKIQQPAHLPMGLPETSIISSTIISETKLYDIQIEKAELFTESGDFKSAIIMLEQARPYVELMEDSQSREKYYYCSALLAVTQANYKDALLHLSKIQENAHNIDTFSKLALKIIEILVKQHPESAVSLSKHFIEKLEGLQEKYKNHSCQVHYTISRINCMIVECKIHQILKEEMTTSEIEMLLDLCKVFDKAATIFENTGFLLESCKTLFQLSQIKFKLSALENGTDFHKFMFLEGLEHSQNALTTLNSEKKKLKLLGLPHTQLTLFTHQIIENHCHLSRMYHFIALEVTKVQKQFRISDSQKDVIDKQIESYISEPVILSSLEDKWQKVNYSAIELSKAHGDNAVRLCESCHLQFTTDSHNMLGKSLSATSHALFEDSIDVWNTDIKENEVVTRDVQMEILSMKYLTSSMEFLSQAVQICLIKQDHVTLQSACLEIISRIGYQAPQISTQYLCLYQSSVASSWLHRLCKQALYCPNKSEVGSLISQLQQAYQANNYQLYNQSFDELHKTNSCWKRMLVFENHYDILREIDDKQYFLILQHSPCKKYLFSGFVQGGKSTKSNSENVLCISRHDVNFKHLELITTEYKTYNIATHKYLAKLVHFYKLQSQTQQRKILMDKLGVENDSENYTDLKASLQTEKLKLEEQYQKLISDLWEYLKPAVEAFNKEYKKILDPDTQMVLLADITLQNLPLDALPLSKIGNLKCYARDFSISTYYHRLLTYSVSKSVDPAAPPDTKRVAKTPVSSARGDRTKNVLDKRIFSDRIPLIPPSIDPNSIKYLVNSDSSLKCGDVNIVDEVSETLKSTQAKTSRWSGYFIQNSQCSAAEIQELLSVSSGFLYCGIGKLLSQISADLLACLNLTNSHLHIISDKAVSAFVLRHETYCDEIKDKTLPILETPVELAGILYLAGSVLSLINTEMNSCDDNVSFVCSLIKTVVENEISVGAALHITRFPVPAEIPLAPTPDKKAKGKPVKGKSDVTAAAATLADISFMIQDNLKPSTFNMAAFGVPQVSLGDAGPTPGRKSGSKK